MGLDSSLSGLKQNGRPSSKDVPHEANGTKVPHHTSKGTSLLSKFIESHRELESYK